MAATRFALVFACIVTSACGVGADYNPVEHPCSDDGDCRSGTYCGVIGSGTESSEQASDRSPSQGYCLRKSSGDCCPPSAPPMDR